jgi:hypothetical protein
VTSISASKLAGVGGYSDPNYFYTDKTDGAMTFMDPQTGITTSGSQHCRTELHEGVNWSAIGTNILTVTGDVVQLGGGSGGHTTVGQVFDANTSKPLGELQFNGNGSMGLYLESSSSGGSGNTYSLGSQSIGKQYTYSLSLTGSTLTVTVNGAKSTYTADKSFNGAQFYFKCGNYDQTATAGTPSTKPYTVVKVYALNIQHLNNPSSISFWASQSPLARSRLNRIEADHPGETLFDLRGRTLRTFAQVSALVNRARSEWAP